MLAGRLRHGEQESDSLQSSFVHLVRYLKGVHIL